MREEESWARLTEGVARVMRYSCTGGGHGLVSAHHGTSGGRIACSGIWSSELSFHVSERVEELRAGGMSEPDAVPAARQQFGNYTRRWKARAIWTSTIRSIRWPATSGPPCARSAGAGIHGHGGRRPGARDRRRQRGIFGDLCGPAPAAAFPNADRLVKWAAGGSESPGRVRGADPVGGMEPLNTTFQAISGYYSQDECRTSGELPRNSRTRWWPPFLQVLGIASATRPRLHSAGGAVRRAGRRSDQRPPLVAAASAGRSRRQDAPHRPGSVPIIGVMPPSFLVPDRDADLWSVSAPDAPYAQNPGIDVVHRHQPPQSRRDSGLQARANLAAVQANLGRQYPKTDAALLAAIEPLKESTVGGIPEIALDPLRIGVAAAADRVHQCRGAAAVRGLPGDTMRSPFDFRWEGRGPRWPRNC